MPFDRDALTEAINRYGRAVEAHGFDSDEASVARMAVLVETAEQLAASARGTFERGHQLGRADLARDLRALIGAKGEQD